MLAKSIVSVWALVLTGLSVETAQASGRIEFIGSVINPACRIHHIAGEGSRDFMLQRDCARQNGQSPEPKLELRDLKNQRTLKVSRQWDKHANAYRLSHNGGALSGTQVLSVSYP